VRKITRDSVDAFLNGRNFKRANMSVEHATFDHMSPVTVMCLHGHAIARKVTVSSGGFGVEESVQIRVLDCGYQTVTTKERINGLLSLLTNGRFGVYQKDFTWYLHDRIDNHVSRWTGGACFNERGEYLHPIDA